MLRFKWIKLLFIFVFLGGTLAFSAQNIYAADAAATEESLIIIEPTPLPVTNQPVNLTVSPVFLNLATDPGKKVVSAIKVLNNGTEKEYLRFELVKFTADQSGSKPQIKEFSANDEYKNWLTFEKNIFEVNPGEWQTIEVTFSPPQEAALVYYYAIIIKRQADTRADSATTVITGAPAILVLANVYSPNAVQELQLVEFKIKQKFYEYLPTDFEVVVKNTGNVHLSPLGNIFIDRGDKKDVALLSINKESGLILPDSQRSFLSSWDEGFPTYQPVMVDEEIQKDDRGEVIKKLKWDFSKLNQFRIGRYSAHLLLVYDSGTRDIPIEAVVSFWVIPWRLMLGALVVAILISMGIISPLIMLRNRVKK